MSNRQRPMASVAQGAIIATCLMLNATLASAVDYNLKFAHFYPLANHYARDTVPDWTGRIERATNGRVTITQYPSGQLLKPAETYDGVRSGVADIGMVVPGLTPGRFPESALVDLPFAFHSAAAASRAVMELYEKGMFAKDYAGMQVLYLHVIDLSTIHTRTTPVKTPVDLKGLRIRFPTAAMKDLLSAYGAVPVGMGPTQIYESLERGVIDGYTGAWDSLTIFRLGELVRYHLDLPLYTLLVCICMNKQSFDRMPADIRKAMMDNSGVGEAAKVGKSYDVGSKDALAGLDKTKHVIIKPNAEEEAQWRHQAEPVVEAQLKSIESKGVNAHQSYKLLREAAKKYEVR